MSGPIGVIYSCNEFTIDTNAYELRRGDRPVPIEPQVFELIVG
jgi:DNA-binding winged helix-turn-helix (wHTH) protein